MNNALNVLIIEDSEDDTYLLLKELRRGGYLVRFKRVETAEQMRSALEQQKYEIVFADYSLPQFSGPMALELLKESGIDIPFIIISGTVAEEVAVIAMKAGAHDYLLKGNLKRLLPAVERELRDAQQRAARRQADEALRLQTVKLAEQAVMLDLAHVMARDLEGKITLWTRGMERLYGWTSAEAVGTLSQSILRTKFPQPVLEIETELRARGFWQGELVQTTRNGEQLVVATLWVLHRDPTGNPLMVLEVDNDITGRRRMEEALRVSEAQYRILFDSNPHPMWVYEQKTLRFLAVNDAAVQHYGYSRSEFVDMTIKNLRTARANSVSDHSARDSKKRSNSRLWKHYKKDGTPIDIEMTSHGIIFSGRQAQLVLALDVTEKVKAQEALQEKADELASMTQQLWHASKLATMGELAASVAHELNNPLATISLRVETLLTQLDGDDQKHHSLEIIISEVERMANLVTNLLQFTRRHHRQVSTIEVSEEINKSIELISYYLRNRRIEVIKEFDELLPPIHADRQQLRQVFLNLMTNAGDAMSEGGVLTVRVKDNRVTARIVIDFTDTGKGISAEDLEKVWEPFYTSKAEGKGTGLGLSICSRIVEEHGGAIMLESKEGTGTTARVVLPVANAKFLSQEAETAMVTETPDSGSNHAPRSSGPLLTPGRLYRETVIR